MPLPFLCGGLFVSRVTLKVRNRLQLHLAGSEFERKGGFPLKISSDYRAFLKRFNLKRDCGVCTAWQEHLVVM